ncbi:VOC family protein [Pseudonocardia sp. KRD-291]|nr:VOC family protein [Pseudonocardia sp. KRD291]
MATRHNLTHQNVDCKGTERAIGRNVEGAGPNDLSRCRERRAVLFRRRRNRGRDAALAQVGGTHVELIQQLCDGPSVYRDAFPDGVGGFHHVAVLVPDVDAARRFCEERGIGIAMSLTFGQTSVIYADTRRGTRVHDRSASRRRRDRRAVRPRRRDRGRLGRD